MKKAIVIVVGVLIASALAYFFHPFFTQKKASEKLEDIVLQQNALPATETSMPAESVMSKAAEPEILKRGSFEGVGAHSAKGTALLVRDGEKYFVRLDDDFDVTNGPDLYVSFGRAGEYRSEGLLAPLKGNSGGQNYAVPSSIDVTQYDEVWIWCKRFSVGFGKAMLR